MKFDNTRIQKLRSAMLVQPSICVERAKLITESYRATEGEAAPIRRAKAFAHLLKHMTIRIYPDELIVGRPTSKVRGGSISPELQCDWILKELDILSTRETDPFEPLTQEERDVLADVVPYWETRSLRYHWNQEVGEEHKPYDDLIMGGGAFSGNNQFPGHASPDYGQLVTFGVEGLIRKVEERLSRPADEAQRAELEGMKLCLEAMAGLGDRYAAEARRMAAEESDPVRRQELLDIAAICDKVPRKAPETFREAIQALWFGYMCVMLENWGTGNTFLRIDQYLAPLYEADRAKGLSLEEAYQYLAMLLVNCNSACVVYSEARSHGFAGNCSGCSFTIGGVKPDGSCAVNELSYLFLEAEACVGLVNEDLVVRVSPRNPRDFLVRACEVARDLKGKLKFVSDTTTIRALTSTGIPLEDANNYISTGCHNPTIPAVTHDIGGSSFNYPLILDLLLHRGVSPVTGQQLGIDLGDPRDFATFEALADAFEREFEYVMRRLFYFKNADLSLYEQMPCPLLSSFYEGCMERGLDINENGVRLTTHTSAFVGVPNVGDSLAAIKKTIYEDKSLTWDRLLRLLDNNLEGDDEAVYLLRRVPKFGNNQPYVDDLTRDVLARSCDYLHTHTSYRGVKTTAACLAMTINIPFGHVVGAQPDGRKRDMPLSEGGISPYQGRNTAGFTSTLASVAHLDQVKLSHGSILNVRLSAKAVASPAGIGKFADALLAFCETGGDLVQFNFVDGQVLRDAQIHPERYRDLLVRVATYSAYYVELSRDLQDDIIRRYEFDRI